MCVSPLLIAQKISITKEKVEAYWLEFKNYYLIHTEKQYPPSGWMHLFVADIKRKQAYEAKFSNLLKNKHIKSKSIKTALSLNISEFIAYLSRHKNIIQDNLAARQLHFSKQFLSYCWTSFANYHQQNFPNNYKELNDWLNLFVQHLRFKYENDLSAKELNKNYIECRQKGVKAISEVISNLDDEKQLNCAILSLNAANLSKKLI